MSNAEFFERLLKYWLPLVVCTMVGIGVWSAYLYLPWSEFTEHLPSFTLANLQRNAAVGMPQPSAASAEGVGNVSACDGVRRSIEVGETPIQFTDGWCVPGVATGESPILFGSFTTPEASYLRIAPGEKVRDQRDNPKTRSYVRARAEHGTATLWFIRCPPGSHSEDWVCRKD